jgi:hypothetical protein
MKRLVILLVAGLAVALPNPAAALGFSFSSTGNAQINFDGAGNFSFPNSTTINPGRDFQIGLQFPDPAWPDGTLLSGLVGNLDGTFALGAVSSCGSGCETAPVTGAGVFSVFDGSDTFSATLTFINANTTGTGGTLNFAGSVNLTGFSYAGSNADLVAFAGQPEGYLSLTFQFVPGKSLTTLKSSPAVNTHSGTAAVPEPMAIFMLGGGLLGLSVVVRRSRRI